MIRPIDEKIVAMKMDNSDFKRKAQETTSLFGKLRQSLNKIPGISLGNTTRELGNISRASNSTINNIDGIGRSLDTISSRFSTLGVIGTTALVNISNKAVNAGLALTKSLTTDQLVDGFREYEMKMGSINTMLANTEWAGTTLEDVKKTLGELNDYADKTIYSFAQMTQNIGRFTAAGVTLGDSTIAIKGLGNLAAISGSTSDQLNTAMYQMSQALASGKLTLMDWNSMVNAGMGGKKTQDALVATARAMGIAVDMSDGFRNSIEDGWLTSKVLLETLKQFGADESMTEAATKVRTFTQMMASLKEGIGSGWAETWELIFGDFEEATRLWSGLSKIISKPFEVSAELRNNFLRALIDGDGLSNMFSSLINVVKPFGQIFGAIGDGFKAVFPPVGVDRVISLSKAFNEFSKGMQLSEGSVKNLKTIFQGIFAIFSSVWEIVKALTNAMFGLLPSFGDVGAGLLSILSSIATMSINFNEAIKSGSIFTGIMNGLSVVLGVVGLGISYIGKGLGWLAELLKPLGSLIGITFGNNDIATTNKELVSMKEVLEPIANFFKGIFESIVNGFNWVKEKLVGFGNAIKSSLPDGQQLLAGGFIAALIAITTNAIMMGKRLFDVFTGWGAIGDGVTEVLEEVSGALKAFSMNLYADALISVSIAIGILAGSLLLISRLDSTDIAEGLYAMTGALSGLIGGLAIVSKYNLTAQFGSVAVLLALSGALLIVSGALSRLKDLDFGQITKGIFGLTGIMGALAGSLVVMSRFSGSAVDASAIQILAIATSMHILVSAIEKMSGISVGSLIKGMTTLGIAMTQIAIFLRIANGTKFGIGASLGVLAISKAIDNIVNSVVKIATINTDILTKGLTTIGLILAAIGGFAAVAGGTGLLAAGAGVMIIAFAIKSLIEPMTTLGNIPLDILRQGLIGMSVALLAVATASMLMSGSMTGAVSILILAGALNALMVPMYTLSQMTWEGISKGIVGLSAAILLIGGATLLLTPAAPALLAFGVAVGVMGLAMLAAGAGMSLFGTGLLVLSTLSVGAITTILASMGTFIAGLISLAPTVANFVGEIISKIMDTVDQHAPQIVDKFMSFLTKMLRVVADRIPEFIDAGTDIVVNFIDGIAGAYPRILGSAVNLVITYIEGMANAIETEGPRMTDAMMRLWGNVLLVMIDAGVSMVNALFGWIPGITDATKAIGESAEKTIRENFRSIVAGQDKGDEFATGLSSTSKQVKSAGMGIAEAGKSGVASVDTHSDGVNFGEGFVLGISSMVRKAASVAKDLALAASNTIKEKLGIHSPAELTTAYGKFTGQGFNIGLESTQKDTAKKANSIAGVMMNWLGIDSPAAKETSKGGKKAAEGFSKGIESSKPKVKSSAKKVADVAREAFDKAMDKAKYKLEMDEINSEQYIKELNKIKKSYSSYEELVMKVNREIKKAEEDVAKEKEERIKAEFNRSKTWISDRKFYNELSLTEELAAWERVMARYKWGTEERKEAEREVYRVKKEINDKLIAINNDYMSKVEEANQRLIEGERQLNDEYERAVSDRARSLTDFVGLFDKVGDASDVSGKELIANLKGQVKTFMLWKEDIEDLAHKGIDEGLLGELRQMGPKAAGEIRALNTLTEEQLSQYSSLWRVKNELARTEAIDQLEGLRLDTNNKIQKLRDDTATELDKYKTEWVAKIKELRSGTTNEMSGLKTSLTDIGTNSIKGLISGMDNMKGALQAKAKSMADMVSSTIKSALKIKSPSRVTMGIGEYVTEGLANGILNRTGNVVQSAKDLAVTAKDSLSKFLDGFGSLDDNELRIKLVVDYDSLDPSKIGNLKPIVMKPDTGLTSMLTTSVASNMRQNGNKDLTTNDSKTTKGVANNDSSNSRPIIIQSILNGRVIAEETFGDISELMGNRTNLDFAMKGV